MMAGVIRCLGLALIGGFTFLMTPMLVLIVLNCLLLARRSLCMMHLIGCRKGLDRDDGGQGH